MNNSIYQNPLINRYNEKDISSIFSDDFKFSTWRKLWVVLAEEQKNLGVNISDQNIQKMKDNINNIDYNRVQELEKSNNHEVMSHIYEYGEKCGDAAKIIHLGATSAFVLDNTDLIQMKKSMLILKDKMYKLISCLKNFTLEYKNIQVLGYTHLQVAQSTTVGKRASLWLQDLIFDYEELLSKIELVDNNFRSIKGTIGTQNSFFKLFDGNEEKVYSLEKNLAYKMGFKNVIGVSGQTYTRKIDCMVLGVLGSIGQTFHKMTNDLRILQNFLEITEQFSKEQVGSSAMPYKQNPIISERISSLSKYLINSTNVAVNNFSTQWLERTLDDSANRRMLLPQSFIMTSIIIDLAYKLISNISVNTTVINNRINDARSFLISEDLMIVSVLNGSSRQVAHESIRKIRKMLSNISFDFKTEKEEEKMANLLIKEARLNISLDQMVNIIKRNDFSGLASSQVDRYINNKVKSILNS